MSLRHASLVPLCLDLDTGAIGPQFHVVFDDDFATMTSSPDQLPDLDSLKWEQLFGNSIFQYLLDTNYVSASTLDSCNLPPECQTFILDASAIHCPAKTLPVIPPANAPAALPTLLSP